ncbi:MAG TPA: methylmalonyl-CoA mutase family protein [Chloroflexota bacterium]|nr:methylmalonyl-CoA mutase family protein [Chloroflexota bacterium]
MTDDEVFSPSGIPLDQWYGNQTSGPPPGEFPYTRGLRPEGYRQRPWTMRQYAGFGSAEESNRRFKMLLAGGQTGLSVAFDLPTQIGYASDDPLAEGEVGRVGVHIDSLADMEALFADIPLGEVTTSMTINATAALLLLLYQLVGERQGVDPANLGGTIQNDILKEYIARGTYIFPPRHSMRLITDTFAYCGAHLPQWNTISISGYHIREAGATAVQELAFTMANAIAYVEAAQSAGLHIDQFGPRLSFFFNGHSDFFEEIAKFRAARAMWARITRDRFGATNPRSMMLRFHTQTAGWTLTAQQPLNNVVRVALQAMAAVLGGAQSLHTNGYDEALGLPTSEAAMLALRTQQIIAGETGVTAVTDPLGGAPYIESLTAEVERRAWALIERIDALGGAVAATEQGFMQREIEESAYETQRKIEEGRQTVVGVNRYRTEDATMVETFRIDPKIQAQQEERWRLVRETRDNGRLAAALDAVALAARGSENMLPPMKAALAAYAGVGEICGILRSIWGEHKE